MLPFRKAKELEQTQAPVHSKIAQRLFVTSLPAAFLVCVLFWFLVFPKQVARANEKNKSVLAEDDFLYVKVLSHGVTFALMAADACCNNQRLKLKDGVHVLTLGLCYGMFTLVAYFLTLEVSCSRVCDNAVEPESETSSCRPMTNAELEGRTVAEKSTDVRSMCNYFYGTLNWANVWSTLIMGCVFLLCFLPMLFLAFWMCILDRRNRLSEDFGSFFRSGSLAIHKAESLRLYGKHGWRKALFRDGGKARSPLIFLRRLIENPREVFELDKMSHLEFLECYGGSGLACLKNTNDFDEVLDEVMKRERSSSAESDPNLDLQVVVQTSTSSSNTGEDPPSPSTAAVVFEEIGDSSVAGPAGQRGVAVSSALRKHQIQTAVTKVASGVSATSTTASWVQLQQGTSITTSHNGGNVRPAFLYLRTLFFLVALGILVISLTQWWRVASAWFCYITHWSLVLQVVYLGMAAYSTWCAQEDLRRMLLHVESASDHDEKRWTGRELQEAAAGEVEETRDVTGEPAEARAGVKTASRFHAVGALAPQPH
eukprot:g10474.t1